MAVAIGIGAAGGAVAAFWIAIVEAQGRVARPPAVTVVGQRGSETRVRTDG